MQNCWQFENKQTVWQHGISVYRYTRDVINVLEGKESKLGQKIPEWIQLNAKFLLDNLISDNDIKLYTLFHDCGKPFTKEYG